MDDDKVRKKRSATFELTKKCVEKTLTIIKLARNEIESIAYDKTTPGGHATG